MQRGIRRVHDPRDVRTLTGPNPREDEGSREHEQPQSERIDSGEGKVLGADLQRQDVIHEAGDHRHGPEENHGGAVEGEERVVFVVGQEIVFRQRQLNTEQQRQKPTDQEEEEPEQEVHDADFFVVRGR